MQEKMEKKSNFFERILQVIDCYKIKNVKSFACDYLGYASMEKINRLQKDGTSPSYDILVDISNKFENISPEWLLTGKGEMLKSTSFLYKDEQNKELTALQSRQGIPLIPLEAFAGFGTENSAQIFDYECEKYVIPNFRGAEFLISVRGSSMYPKYASGDIVACKKLPLDTFFQWNKVYVLDTEQGVLIKRVKQATDNEHILLVSENEKYGSFEVCRSDIHSLAIVIGVIRLE
jgi:phage repressor protein C with HTH and peptisase S24 domain